MSEYYEFRFDHKHIRLTAINIYVVLFFVLIIFKQDSRGG